MKSDLRSKKLDVETFLCQSRKKISFSKINLLNLGKNLVGPWGSTQLGERSPKPVSHPKSDTRKVSRPRGPQNHPTCTCTPVPRVSARDSPLIQCTRATLIFLMRSKGYKKDLLWAASAPSLALFIILKEVVLLLFRIHPSITDFFLYRCPSPMRASLLPLIKSINTNNNRDP